MTELSGAIVSPAIKAAVNYNTTGQACADSDIQEIADVSVLRLAMPDFRQRGTTRELSSQPADGLPFQ